jgi:hypothetical protein
MRPPPTPALADPVDPARVRTRPRHHFAWVDPRRRDRLRDRRLEAIALVFFLPLAADTHGLSFWSDAPIARKLGLREGDVTQARDRLIATGLIAYRDPLSQILALGDARP